MRHEVNRTSEINGRPNTAPSYEVSVCTRHTHGTLAARLLAGERMQCFLGLSPTTPFVNRGRLQAILEWLVPRSTSLLIVEGLFASRWNLIAVRGLTMAQAIDELGKRILRLQRRIDDITSISGLAERAVRFLDWQGELQNEQYIEVHSAVCQYAKTHGDFRAVLRETTRGYMSKVHPVEVERLSLMQWETLSCYVVEELAMFLHLYRLGYKVEVYPGSDLEIVEAACAGQFAGFPLPCPERTHISLELKHR